MEFLFGGFEADMMCSLLIEIMPSFVHGVVIDKFITGIFQPAASSKYPLSSPSSHITTASDTAITDGDVSLGEETTISEEGRDPKKAHNA
ncbi:hypothetical protein YC2023_020886 [Brassica napus]